MILISEYKSTGKKACPNVTLNTIKFSTGFSEIEPESQYVKPATNCLGQSGCAVLV
jgi:hypothetical protein